MIGVSLDKTIKRIIVCVAFVIAMFIILGVVFVTVSKNNIDAEKVNYLTEVSIKSADMIRIKLESDLETLKGVATFIGCQPTLEERSILPILTVESNRSLFKRMGIITKTGRAVTTDGYTLDFSKREYFSQALNGKCNVSNKLVDIVDNQEIVVLAVPIYHKGLAEMVLFATQRVDQLEKVLSVSSFNGEGYSYIIRSDGTPVIYTSHPGSIGKYENMFDEIVAEVENKSIIPALKKDFEQGNSGSFSFERRGVRRQVSYSKIGVNDWYMISVVPTRAISGSSNKLVVGTIAAVSLILIMVIFLGYVLIRFYIKSNESLTKVAFTDNITGYANWNKFISTGRLLLQAHRDRRYAMVAMDIDKFKVINDIYGYQKGNEILTTIAQILQNNMGEDEIFCRSSADHFHMLMKYRGEADIINKMRQLTVQIAGILEGYVLMPAFGVYKIDNIEYNFNLFNDRASLAKQTIKGKRDENIAFFSQVHRDALLKEQDIENDMEAALRNDEFEVYLQPKYSFFNAKIVGAEALVRWNRPGKGLVAPDEFIPLFEKNGFVKQVDSYVLGQVCSLLRRMEQENWLLEPFTISVNLSRMHMSNSGLTQDLLEIVKSHGLSPNCIEIELTESAVFGDSMKLVSVMKELKAAGFVISIDDFGSGYSSLNVLKDLPADVIKLDRGFLLNTAEDARGREIVVSLIRMAKALNLDTVAEGVETSDQADFLKSAGCDIAQGYYYAKPMPFSSFQQLLLCCKVAEGSAEK